MELGRLEAVLPRTVWLNEARDFTPWLLANGERLGEALGIELELTAAEHPVGTFSLDLVGRDLTNDAILIVENQLEGTDHSHLGQILTYTAGTGASTIVWVATAFREEHRQALDWLNEHTDEGIHFFGVQVAVVKIGDSQPAPLFDVVAKPNEWQKKVRHAARATSAGGRSEQYLRFWQRYLQAMAEKHPEWGRRGTPQPSNWMSFAGPIRGTQLNPSFAMGHRLRSELYIDTGDGEANEQLFERLLSQRASLDSAYGEPLEFEPIEGKRACRIASYRPGSILKEDEWDSYIEWFLDRGARLRAALSTVEFGAAQES